MRVGRLLNEEASREGAAQPAQLLCRGPGWGKVPRGGRRGLAATGGSSGCWVGVGVWVCGQGGGRKEPPASQGIAQQRCWLSPCASRSYSSIKPLWAAKGVLLGSQPLSQLKGETLKFSGWVMRLEPCAPSCTLELNFIVSHKMPRYNRAEKVGGCSFAFFFLFL